MKPLALLTVLSLACGEPPRPSAPTPPAPSSAPTPAPDLSQVPNTFFLAADRTYIRPTGGDARARQIGAAQIDLVRADARLGVTTDQEVMAKGWPTHPIVYGGPNVNVLVAGLASVLPFTLTPKTIVLGGEVFEGDDLRLITAVPAHPPEHPAFVLYAATQDHGLAEINSGAHGPDPILVRDAFGALVTGRWVVRDGAIVAELGPRARRIAWRTIERRVGAMPVRFRFPEMVPPAPGDTATVDACVAGIERTVSKLALTPSAPLDVYVYPDRRSKLSLTNDPGDGHAVPAAHALHVLAAPAAALTALVAHEATHVLAVDAFGLAGMPLTGEGLAVWVSGQYGGVALADWRLDGPPHPMALVGGQFRALPESVSYPNAGMFMAVAIEQLGLATVTTKVLPMSPLTWRASWEAIGVDQGLIALEAQKRLTK